MRKIFFNYKKILMILLIIILILLVAITLFMKLWLPFGETLSKKNKDIYIDRASNYQEGKFYNENKYQVIYEDYYEHNFISNKETIPSDKIPIATPNLLKAPDIDILNITWLGHSSLLLQLHGMNILIDPIFSDKPSPLSFIGTERFSEVPINASELPNIDIVLITHDHYDHLDYQTIKDIDSKVAKYIVPLGVENHLERWEISKEKITNMSWWEEIDIDGLLISCTPARHNSGRGLFNQNSTLWASWVLIDENYKVFLSGDTGFNNHFKKISNKYGQFDIAFLDSGQYDTRWKDLHMTPEEAVNAGIDLNAKVLMPIHWGTFKLARHPWDDPIKRFIIKAEETKIKYITPKMGETIIYQENIETNKWWKNIR